MKSGAFAAGTIDAGLSYGKTCGSSTDTRSAGRRGRCRRLERSTDEQLEDRRATVRRTGGSSRRPLGGAEPGVGRCSIPRDRVARCCRRRARARSHHPYIARTQSARASEPWRGIPGIPPPVPEPRDPGGGHLVRSNRQRWRYDAQPMTQMINGGTNRCAFSGTPSKQGEQTS